MRATVQRKSSAVRFQLAILLASVAMVATVMSADCRSLYDKMLFHPVEALGEDPVAIVGTKKQAVTFTTRGGKVLHAWYFNPPDSDKLVLVSEGNGGNMSYRTWLIEILLKLKASVFIYDYEGYGLSEGRPSLKTLVGDGLAAYDFVSANKLAEGKKLILFGESLGTGVTCQIAASRK